MLFRSLIHSAGFKTVVFCLFLALVFGHFMAVPANADTYFSSQIWLDGNTVYSRSETYIDQSDWDELGSMASLEATLEKDSVVIDQDSDCYRSRATVNLHASKAPGVWIAWADHSSVHASQPCYNWVYSEYTYAELDLRQPVINYFYASPTRITPPGAATLYFGTQYGTTANINGTPVTLNNGSLSVSPSTTTSYTLTVSNQGFTTQATVTVWVNPPLTPAHYQYSVRHEKGATPYFPVLSLGGQSVNSANGNLFFQVPLLSRPGRNGLGVSLALAYNSKIWDFYVQSSNLYATLAEPDSWVGAGWTLMVARVIDDTANGHYYVTLSDGSNHDLTYYGGAWRSKDSTYMVYDPAAYKLTLKGGMNLRFDHVDELRSYARYATRVQDTNGNYIDIAYADYGGRISSIQDTLGNTYTFLLNSNGRLQYLKYWNTNDVSQATSTITFSYLTQNAVFGAGATTDPLLPSQGMLTGVTYPTGLHYDFTYQASGEMSEIVNPICGRSRYYYTSYTVLDQVMGRTVPEHFVSSYDTGNEDTWTWSYNVAGQAAPTIVSVVVPNSSGTITHYMQKSSPGWADGFVTKVVKSGTPGTESRQDWIQDDQQLTTILNPRASYEEQVLKGGTEKVTRTEFSYADATDRSGNIKEIRKYSFTGALLRKSTFSYLHEADGRYVPLNILDRPTVVLVKDGVDNPVSKTVTAYDQDTTLYGASGAIRHDAAFGTSYVLRGLPTSVTRWYDIVNNLSVASSVAYDECGNPRETTDPMQHTTSMFYWVTGSDYSYAFPLLIVNPKGHTSGFVYSSRSGVLLNTMDANGKTTSMLYDNKDRVTRVNKPGGGVTTYTYSDYCNCLNTPPSTPHAEIREYVSGSADDPNNTKYQERRAQVDSMGRLVETTVSDPVGGEIKGENSYGVWSQVTQQSVPRRETDPVYWKTYNYDGVGSLSGISLPDGGGVSFSRSNNYVTVAAEGSTRRAYYNEDGKIIQVVDEDSAGQLTVPTDYSYDALGRLSAIIQGVQTRSFTYDDIGRLKSETHPESGTATYSYDANSNLHVKTEARGISTTFTYDELNRVVSKTYSDGTPSVSYFYDSQPAESPISILNPIGRLTRVTTTASGVTTSNYYSYCNCSSVDLEATVITDGITKTYITSYSYNYIGGITSIIYPNGKHVTYTRDDVGRETKVYSSINGQSIDYVRSAAYLGPSGQLSEVLYGIRSVSSWPYGWLTTLYSYSPQSLRLTYYQTHGLRQTLNYTPPGYGSHPTEQIYDITDTYNPDNNKHYEYDNWHRLTAYWKSAGRDDPYSLKYEYTYDRYNNIATVRDFNDPGNCPEEGCVDEFVIDPATNRFNQVIHHTTGQYSSWYSSDIAGNDVTGGRVFDAENRLTSVPGHSYLYDGNSRRLRVLDGTTKTYYVYSARGSLLVEDNWSTGTTRNQVYFNGKLVATHDQADIVWFYFMDYLGSTTSVVEVTPGGEDWTTDWETIQFGSGPSEPRSRYTGKLIDVTGLTYFGARYLKKSVDYWRWISPDPVMTRIYDPPSLNKYTYVRNDPVNLIDPDGMSWLSAIGGFFGKIGQTIGSAIWGGINSYIDSFRDLPPPPPMSDVEADANDYYGDGYATGGPFGGGNYTDEVSATEHTCIGQARVLQGNSDLIGDQGGFPGVDVAQYSAAIIPDQWGGLNKSQLAPYLSQIVGTIGGRDAEDTVFPLFDTITDVISGKVPKKNLDGTPSSPNITVRDWLQQNFPSTLIIEIPGLTRDLGIIGITLTLPIQIPCPTGTKERNP